MLEIWGRTTSSNVQKVLWCCDELGLEYRRYDVGREFGLALLARGGRHRRTRQDPLDVRIVGGKQRDLAAARCREALQRVAIDA